MNNKVVPEMHFVGLLKLKAPACTISVESAVALNPCSFGACRIDTMLTMLP